MTRPIVHMLKDQKNRVITTRCLVSIQMKAGQSLPDVSVTGWEKDVTCPQCVL
jgi:hypothetical protein